MAYDNLLKAVVDAIAESDNEIGGFLITRLTEAHDYGRDNGILETASPTVLSSTVDVFKSSDVGRMIDVLELDTPNGNEGSYTVKTYTDEKTVILDTIDGAAPTFVDEVNVRWRWSSLRVETTLEFPQRDKLSSVWVGEEPQRCPYASVVQTPGAQEILGLGEHVGRSDGRILVADPQKLNGWAEDSFSSADVGKTIWVFPVAGTPSGNEGPRRITAVDADGKVATLAGTAFVADELNVMWAKKTYAGDGYLTTLQKEDAEVVDGSASYSAINQLRRALLIEYAEGEELDRIGRRYGVTRPRGMPDETFRRVLMVLPYMAKTTVYALEILLAAMFPQGGWGVYEDRVSHPCEVFITVPLMAVSEDYEGKAFLDDYEALNSDTTTQVTVTDTPTTVISVTLAPFLQQLEFSALPSADTPAWTYVTQGGAEGSTFSVSASKTLTQVLNGASGSIGGYYQLSRGEIDPEHWDLSVWFQRTASTTIGATPWKMVVDDGEREVCLMWSDTACAIGQSNETTVDTGSLGATTATTWYRFRLQRRGDDLRAYRDDTDLFGKLDPSSFSASSSRRFQFGWWSNGQAQNNVANWRMMLANTEPIRDYWNLRRDDGVLSNPATLGSTAGLFVSGDTDEKVRLYSEHNENDGVWKATYVSGTQLTLAGVQRGVTGRDFEDAAQVFGKTGEGDGAIVTIKSPLFRLNDVGKDLKISGSSLGNDGEYPVVKAISNYQVEVTNASGFATESDLTWEFDPDFVVESNVRWEIINTGSRVAKVLTLRDPLPGASTPVRVWYTTVLSAEVVLNEFVQNKGEAVGEPDLYFPFYIYDIDAATKQMIDEITAAGVIPGWDY